jgi:hypothetical protein
MLDNPTFGQGWIVTNTMRGPHFARDYLEEIDLTLSVTTNVPNGPSASLFESRAARLVVRAREPLNILMTGSARTGGRIMAEYDVRADVFFVDRNAPTIVWYSLFHVNPPLVKVSYFRGRIFYPTKRVLSDEWITVFKSEDRVRLVAVHDGGTIVVSENAGSTWKVMHPGNYEFTLAATAEGSTLVALVSHAETALTNISAPKPAPPKVIAPTISQMTTQNWYAAVSAADGSQLVLTGGPSQSAPALSITSSGENVIITWPAAFTGLILQRNMNLGTTNWINVTTRVEVNGTQNQVALPMLHSRDFFRLIALP